MTDSRRLFAQLHCPGEPLILCNVWDVGTARIASETGAKAIATGSLGVAGALGYDDGEIVPLAGVLQLASRICEATNLPLTVDFEGGYAADGQSLNRNASLLAETGAVGCNLEDRIVGKGGLHTVADQSIRIAAVAASGLFVNARTDLFLQRLAAGENANDPLLMSEALDRAVAYAEAGADCYFVPGLSDAGMIAELCKQAPLPINVMRLPELPNNADLAALGVARISYGPGPWRAAMEGFREQALAALLG